MKDEEKLNLLTKDWVKEIISQVTDEESAFFDIDFVSKIFERTQNNLKDTIFEYIEEDKAKKEYGDEVKLYIKSQGLPRVKLNGTSNKVYLKEILEIQFKIYEDLLNDSSKVDEASLSDYVYYSITAHFLCTMV